MSVAAVIPAFNEEPTVGDVVAAARGAHLVDEVIVVDNGSQDRTAAVAREGGATVVPCDEPGKGQAMRAGVDATSADVIVFLDADLLNLRPDHVDDLVRPILDGTAGMILGLFDRGEELNPVFLNALPRLTGQRAMRRGLFLDLDDKDVKGYKVEAALNSRAKELGLEVKAFVCDGLWHRTKEEKEPDGPMAGMRKKIVMLLTAMWSYISYRLVRRWRQSVKG